MRQVIVLTLAILLVACNRANIQPLQQVADEVSGEVRIYRPDTFLMKLMPAIVSVNNVDAVTLHRDSASSVKLQSGRHLLKVRGSGTDSHDGCELNIDLKKGEVKYLELVPASSSGSVAFIPLANFFVCKFELQEVSADTAVSQYESYRKIPVTYF